MKWPHTVRGVAGYYEWAKGGWWGYRAEAFHAMAKLLGGAALAEYEVTLAATDTSVPAAEWFPGEFLMPGVNAPLEGSAKL